MAPELYIKAIALDLAWKNPDENIRKIEASIIDSRLVPGRFQVLVFPELTLTGFVTDELDTLSFLSSDALIESVRDLAKKYQVHLVFGYPEKNPNDPSRPFNRIEWVNPLGDVEAYYRKVHLFPIGKNPEKNAYSSGEGPVSIDIEGWRVGFGICYDLRFPEWFAQYRNDKVDLLILSACWVGGAGKHDQWDGLTRGHAASVRAFFTGVNRSGRDPEFSYEGEETYLSPTGQLIQEFDAHGWCRMNQAALIEARRVPVI